MSLLNRSRICACVALASLAAPSLGFGYVFTSLAPPNGQSTQPYGINSGLVVSATTIQPSGLGAGVLYQNGSSTIYMYPNSMDTDFYQINNSGQVAADYFAADGIYHGIVYNSATSSYTNLPDSPTYANNLAGGISNNGLIAGNFFADSSFTNGVAWIYSGGIYKTFTDPNAAPGGLGTATYGINNAGVVVGFYTDANNVDHAYSYDGTSFTSINPPGSTDTIAFGINDNGTIVGRYIDANGVRHGFLDENGQFISLEYPGAGPMGSGLSGINDEGDLVGYYFDAAGNYYVFEATVPEPGSILLLIGIGAAAGLRRRPRRATAIDTRVSANLAG